MKTKPKGTAALSPIFYFHYILRKPSVSRSKITTTQQDRTSHKCNRATDDYYPREKGHFLVFPVTVEMKLNLKKQRFERAEILSNKTPYEPVRSIVEITQKYPQIKKIDNSR